MLLTFKKEIRTQMELQDGDRVSYQIKDHQVSVRKHTKGYKVSSSGQAVLPSYVVAVMGPRKGERIVVDRVSEGIAYLAVVEKSRKTDPVLHQQVSRRSRDKAVARYEKTWRRYGSFEIQDRMNAHDIALMFRHMANLIESKKDDDILIRIQYRKVDDKSDMDLRPVYTYTVGIRIDNVNQTITHVTTCDMHSVSEEILDEYPGSEVIYVIPLDHT